MKGVPPAAPKFKQSVWQELVKQTTVARFGRSVFSRGVDRSIAPPGSAVPKKIRKWSRPVLA